jgi:hypothetical protein
MFSIFMKFSVMKQYRELSFTKRKTANIYSILISKGTDTFSDIWLNITLFSTRKRFDVA